MSTPEVVREVRALLVEREGKPSAVREFDDGPAGAPRRIEVLAWTAKRETSVTLLQSVGMSALPMSDGTRAELRFVVRGVPDARELETCATFIANVAVYPFVNATRFAFWEKLRTAPPLFPSCTGVLFHPRFSPNGIDAFQTSSGEVKVLHLLPITEREAALAPDALHDDFAARGIDVFARR